MIKFSGQTKDEGRPVLGIGLTRDNCEKILEGAPILFNTTNMPGLPPLDVCVFGGEDESSMARDLIDQGAITLEQIQEDPGLVEDSQGEVN